MVIYFHHFLVELLFRFRESKSHRIERVTNPLQLALQNVHSPSRVHDNKHRLHRLFFINVNLIHFLNRSELGKGIALGHSENDPFEPQLVCIIYHSHQVVQFDVESPDLVQSHTLDIHITSCLRILLEVLLPESMFDHIEHILFVSQIDSFFHHVVIVPQLFVQILAPVQNVFLYFFKKSMSCLLSAFQLISETLKCQLEIVTRVNFLMEVLCLMFDHVQMTQNVITSLNVHCERPRYSRQVWVWIHKVQTIYLPQSVQNLPGRLSWHH